MVTALDDVIGKTCLVGLSYFDVKGDLLKQNMLAGTVKSVDKENGITLVLSGDTDSNPKGSESLAEFILPANLNCWFKAPAGEFHTSVEGVKIKDPNFLVTWDIHQTKANVEDGQQQWWEWVARTEPPKVGSN